MFVILAIAFVTVLYLYLKLNNQYWKRRNVEGPEPSLLVGNIGQQFIGKKHLGVIITDIYNKYKDLPYVGIYKATTPCLLVRDPEFVKIMGTTNFKNFGSNEIFVDKKVDPIMGRNPFVLTGAEWKKQRHIITPCFTANKMKAMFPLVDNSARGMVEYINNHLTETFETKELCSKFTIDNVASCAFGVEGRCFLEPFSQFRELAVKFLSPGSVESVKLTLTAIVPQLTKIMSLKLVRADVEDRLREIVKTNLEYREKNNIERQDFLHFMNQLRIQTNGEFTFEDMTAQASAFFLDGYESSSSVMSYLLFELAHSPDKQEKLRQELQEKIEQNKGILTYELINEMTYLDACLIESIRKNTPVQSLGKKCTETYTYVPSPTSGFKAKPITIERGSTIIIPLGGLNNDPKYFDEPDKFIPERHLVKTESKYNFRPFGEGPRACLGQKFGQMQIKVGVYYIISNFRLTLNNKTKVPLKCDPWYFGNQPVGGMWVDLEKI